MSFYANDRLVIFVDGASVYRAAKALQIEIDWRLFRNFFEKKGTLVRAYYYSLTYTKENAQDKNDDEFMPLRPLLDWLDFNGYSVVEKAAYQYTNQSGQAAWRGTMLPEIVVDMCRMFPHGDHYILCAGDGDLKEPVRFCQQNGKRVTILSTIKATEGVFIADMLRRQADDFLDLAGLANLVKRNTDGAAVPMAR